MPSRDLDDLAPPVREQATELIRRCTLLGIDVFPTCTLRTPEEQAALFAQGRTKPGPRVTNAQAWQSWHQPWYQDVVETEPGFVTVRSLALAFDLAFRPEGDPTGATWEGPWEVVGAIGEWIGLEWGGRWKSFPDAPHFQNRLGRSFAEWRRERGFE